MISLHIDFETRSELDLKEVGLHNYARHPSTDVWCMAWSLGDSEPELWAPSFLVEHAFCDHVINDGTVLAHNAAFELEIWNQIMVPRYGWPELKPEQTFCTMAQCYAMGLPGSLEDAALAMGLRIQKDTEGRALMLRMSRPRSTNPTVWWDDPDKLARLYAYCQQDVRVERELHKRLMPLSASERATWLLDYKINQRGVQIDTASAKAAVTLAEKVKVKCGDEINRITAGRVQSVTALPALKEWMADQGTPVSSLAKQDVVDLLQGALPDPVRRVLTLRQEAGKASTAKFDKMISLAGADGRLRNTTQFHGAATGRWAGRGVQVHNLKRATMSASEVERALELVRGVA